MTKKSGKPIVTIHDIDWQSWRPDEVASLLFVVRDGQVLLIHKKQGLGAGKVNAPGGRLEPGETPLQAAVRETEEEVRITPLDLVFAGDLFFQFTSGLALRGHVFRAPDFKGTPAETDEADPFWVPVDQIPYDLMWQDDRLWIPLMLDGARFRGRFVFDDEVMIDHRIDTP